ncbi:DUF7144 family membrane protein [Streptacidiphilus monticola]|jgi:hypothetical protein|uniref:DUF7144 domain-containing protein n=1 Tax=Streptacidiphilus monticola TaxID=2161674 RepID=A0ABW1GB60_9ACTN
MTAVPDGRHEHAGRHEALTGASFFAGIALLVSGPISILLGVTGIARDHLFSPARYAYYFSLTAWGWIHLVVGVALFVAGVGVLADRGWARWAGLTLAGISLVTQFMFLPYYPAWAITMMTLDLLIMWALSRFHPSM